MIPSELRAVRRAQDRLLEELSVHGYSPASVFAIKLAVEEGLSNAIRHGNRCDPAKCVRLDFLVDDDSAVVTIADEGEGFDYDHLDDPTTDENLEKPTGRGIMLMRAYMDEVRFNSKGNRVRMVKFNT